MFDFENNDALVLWPVDVSVPQHGGRHLTKRFHAEFRIVAKERIDALAEGNVDENEFLRDVLVGWGDDLVDQNKEAIPFSAEARDKLLSIPFVHVAVVEAYFACVAGASRKNSLTRPGTGSRR